MPRVPASTNEAATNPTAAVSAALACAGCRAGAGAGGGFITACTSLIASSMSMEGACTSLIASSMSMGAACTSLMPCTRRNPAIHRSPSSAVERM